MLIGTLFLGKIVDGGLPIETGIVAKRMGQPFFKAFFPNCVNERRDSCWVNDNYPVLFSHGKKKKPLVKVHFMDLTVVSLHGEP